jgi:hypothetical protein
MSFTNFQKTIALTSGVLVLSVAIALVVIAWTGPTAEPPLNNAPEPLNVSNIDQTKAGGLTVKELSLNNGIGEGDIRNADRIIGFNDLRIRGDATEQTKIDLGVGAQEIKFYTGGATEPAIAIDANSNLHLPGLSDCFLKVDAAGKVVCDTGGGPPSETEEEFQSQKTLVAHARRGFGQSNVGSDSYTIPVGDEEAIVKVVLRLNGKPSCGTSNVNWAVFKVNGSTVEALMDVNPNELITSIFYWHVLEGDIVSVEVYTPGSCPDEYAEAWIYTLTGKRKDNVTKITSSGDILYFYQKDTRASMGKASGGQYIPPTPSSIVATADGIPITIFTE